MVRDFVYKWSKEIPLVIEFRHTDRYNNPHVSEAFYQLLEAHTISNIIVDTVGRRNILHMQLTNSSAFIRFVSVTHSSDYQRLNDGVVV
ncbi:DUF72 domain-containing protein [Bizionia gelidisalsuginis]|uniref:DUF72 domain-containing protein n=1 Tax=Bizionia gelidisalsuginis TaxID=291188 RepID=UPI003744A87C